MQQRHLLRTQSALAKTSHRLRSVGVFALALLLFVGIIVTHSEQSSVAVAITAIQCCCVPLAYYFPRIASVTYVLSVLLLSLAHQSIEFDFFIGLTIISLVVSQSQRYFGVLILGALFIVGFFEPTDGSFSLPLDGVLVFLFLACTFWALGEIVATGQKRRRHAEEQASNRNAFLQSLLHDTIAAEMTFLIAEVERLAFINPILNNELSHVADSGRLILKNTQSLLRELDFPSDPILNAPHTTGLKESIRRLEQSGFIVKIAGDTDVYVHSVVVRRVLERTLSEVTSNILKHATPNSTVSLTISSTSTTLSICFNNLIPNHRRSNQNDGRLGLSLMHKLVTAVNGSVSFIDEDNRWTTHLVLPSQATSK